MVVMAEPRLTRPEAAAQFRISLRTLDKLVVQHGVPVLRAGRRVVFDALSIKALESACRSASPAGPTPAPSGLSAPFVPPAPRKVSRLTCTVTEVRRHRLHEISETDAQAEGCVKLKATGRAVEKQGAQHFGAVWPSCRMWFADLWDSINGPGSWDANPEIIAITFAAERRNIDG